MMSSTQGGESALEETVSLEIGPRFVKQEGETRPFQKKTIDAIKHSHVKLIFVEAPVGAGKSHIIRRVTRDDDLSSRPIVLTYPTKILMDTQIDALKRRTAKIAVWPDDEDIFPLEGNDSLNILKYSTDSLAKYLLKYPDAWDDFQTRGNLLKHGLFDLKWGSHQAFVTTPDVLWLIYSMKYRGARHIQAQLKSAIVFFDEFHAYANLYNFYRLLENLIVKSKVDKVVLLSATPFVRKQPWAEFATRLQDSKIPTANIDFNDSESGSEGAIFNYPLVLELRNFKYADRGLTLKNISATLEELQPPAAVIFDSMFRLKHLKGEFMRFDQENGGRFKIREWSGMTKDSDVGELVRDQANVIVLGTSAIEVGIDMRFRSLITESSNWASAIQRIGRVGRMRYQSHKDIYANKGYVNLFVNSRDTYNRLKTIVSVSRGSFEKTLQETLPDPAEAMVGGELFRGESHSFILIDRYLPKPVVYSEAIFSMYDVDESRCKNFWGDEQEKTEILREAGIRNKGLTKELILRDRLFPIWGIVSSEGLLNRYVKVLKVEQGEKPKSITVYTETNPAGFCFYKEKIQSSYPEESLW